MQRELSSGRIRRIPLSIFSTVFISILFLFFLSSCKKNTTDQHFPRISSVSPDRGSIGTVVTISGENFSTIANENNVSFGGAKANVSSATANSLVVEAPVHATGKVPVSVTIGDATSNAASFEYIVTAGDDYFPTEGNQYHYKVTSPTDHFEFYTKLLNQKDSAGLKTVMVASYLPSATVLSYAYKGNTETVYQLYPPPQTFATMKLLSQQPGYVSGVLEGFPINQHISNTPVVNEAVSFEGGPIHMHIVQNSDIPSIPLLITDFKQYYYTGKVLGYETVSTAAGSFANCIKWEYTTKTIMETTVGGTVEQNFHRVIWFAKGIGAVKDYEDGPDGRTQSELIAIDQ